jgi:hypothetical protein
MEDPIATMEMISAAIGSLCLAGLLEWLCLRGLMRLMPARAARPLNAIRALKSARVRPATQKLLRVSRLEVQG